MARYTLSTLLAVASSTYVAAQTTTQEFPETPLASKTFAYPTGIVSRRSKRIRHRTILANRHHFSLASLSPTKSTPTPLAVVPSSVTTCVTRRLRATARSAKPLSSTTSMVRSYQIANHLHIHHYVPIPLLTRRLCDLPQTSVSGHLPSPTRLSLTLRVRRLLGVLREVAVLVSSPTAPSRVFSTSRPQIISKSLVSSTKPRSTSRLTITEESLTLTVRILYVLLLLFILSQFS